MARIHPDGGSSGGFASSFSRCIFQAARSGGYGCRSFACLRTLCINALMATAYLSSGASGDESPNTRLRGVRQSNDSPAPAVDVLGRALCSGSNPCRFLVISDLDQQSREIDSSGRLVFRALLSEVEVILSEKAPPGRPVEEGEHGPFVNIEVKPPAVLKSLLNEGGRGMELSDLQRFNGRLMTGDDRTGIVSEVAQLGGGWTLLPRYIINEGDGRQGPKGQKIEWMTKKGGDLYVGSFGKEYAGDDGKILHEHNTWVAVIDSEGRMHREQWKGNYEQMRKATGTEYPGYLTHEAIIWSQLNEKWIAIPRRVSTEAYNSQLDNYRGGDLLILCDEDFSNCEQRKIGFRNKPRQRGCSGMTFVPGSAEQLLAVLMTDEVDDHQSSYLYIVTLEGGVIVEGLTISEEHKYEGIAVAAGGEHTP